MARYTGPVCRLSRREGTDLFLKSRLRPMENKCRAHAPGQHGQKGKTSDYGLQLREKQKIRRTYGVLEKQFRLYFAKAQRLQGSTGLNLLHLLESRLDNVVYRLGFAATRAEARQMVSHGAVLVDGKRLNIPSAQVSLGQVVSLTTRARQQPRVSFAVQLAEQLEQPDWISVNRADYSGFIKQLPERTLFAQDIQEQLVVEFYSR